MGNCIQFDICLYFHRACAIGKLHAGLSSARVAELFGIDMKDIRRSGHP